MSSYGSTDRKTVMKFDTLGNVQIDHTGFKGRACEDATTALMAGLGMEPGKRIIKPEAMEGGVSSAAKEQTRQW